MESRRPWVNLFSSLPDQVKTSQENPKISPLAEMTGDSCMARAVVPCTAAAVDHADTELIGQTKTPDFLVVFLIGLFIRKYENIPAISLYTLIFGLNSETGRR
ncbi:hypothetical protein [Dialister succinatiphilus]|uniref:hypothetical protein n=1 Tax=Dialister succinatiphilus TaxID=487173 RepID=UPI004025D737